MSCPKSRDAGGPSTHRAYAWTVDRTVATLGRDRPPAEIADEEAGQALAALGRVRAGDLEPQPGRRLLIASSGCGHS